jgi:hypothetical protein
MKLKSLCLLTIILVVLFGAPEQAKAQGCSVSVSIASSSATPWSSNCFVPSNGRAFFEVTGTWTGVATVQSSRNGGISWDAVASTTANTTLIVPSEPATRIIRAYFSTATTGTLAGTIVLNSVRETRLTYSNVPIGSVAYSSFGASVIGSATSSAVTDIVIPENFTSTGIGILVGATGGTDKIAVGLYDSSGFLIASTDTAGTTVSTTTNAFQQIAWLNATQLRAGRYAVLVQINGTTATFRRPSTSTFVDVATSSVTGTTFGTLPTVIAMPTALSTGAGTTNAIGPIVYLY